MSCERGKMVRIGLYPRTIKVLDYVTLHSNIESTYHDFNGLGFVGIIECVTIKLVIITKQKNTYLNLPKL